MTRSRWEPRRGDLPPEWIRRRAPVLQDLENNALFRMVAFRRRGRRRSAFMVSTWTLPIVLCALVTMWTGLPIPSRIGIPWYVPLVAGLSPSVLSLVPDRIKRPLLDILFSPARFIRNARWVAWTEQSRLPELTRTAFGDEDYAAGTWACSLVPPVLVARAVRDLLAISLAVVIVFTDPGSLWEILAHPMLIAAAASFVLVVFEPYPSLLFTVIRMKGFSVRERKEDPSEGAPPKPAPARFDPEDMLVLGCIGYMVLLGALFSAPFVTVGMRLAGSAQLGVITGVVLGMLAYNDSDHLFRRLEIGGSLLLRGIRESDPNAGRGRE